METQAEDTDRSALGVAPIAGTEIETIAALSIFQRPPAGMVQEERPGRGRVPAGTSPQRGPGARAPGLAGVTRR